MCVHMSGAHICECAVLCMHMSVVMCMVIYVCTHVLPIHMSLCVYLCVSVSQWMCAVVSHVQGGMLTARQSSGLRCHCCAGRSHAAWSGENDPSGQTGIRLSLGGNRIRGFHPDGVTPALGMLLG